MDSRLRPAPRLSAVYAQRHDLQYFVTGENRDYLADEILLLDESEVDALLKAGDTLFALLTDCAARSLRDPARRALLGVPERAVPFLEWSLAHERDRYACGRFDFSGGFEGVPIHLIEFNADTCSLIPETAVLQPEILRQARLDPVTNGLAAALQATAARQLAQDTGATVIGAYLGYEEDLHNLRTLLAGFRRGTVFPVQMELEHLLFDPDEGVLVELGPERYLRYDLLYKYFPWDWVANEEPTLWDSLAELVQHDKLRVLNPAWSMLLQSKALQAFAWLDHPGHPLLLPTTFRRADLPDAEASYVVKPIFGRTGDNVEYHIGGAAAAANAGVYQGQPVVYQEAAAFNTDIDAHRYQLSVFQAPHACALCCRRQDDFILDDDAEFVSLGIRRPY